MPYDPTRSIQDSPDLSPTTIILNSLKQRGIPITPDNIRRAVIANARGGGGAIGPDLAPDLRNDAPEDNVAAKVEGGGTPTQRGGGGGRGRGRVLPVPPVPPSGPTPPMDRRTDATTSAPPSSAPPIQTPDLMDLLGPAAVGGAGLGGKFLYDYLNRPRAPTQINMGNQSMPPTGRTIDVAPDMISAEARPALIGAQGASNGLLPAPSQSLPPPTDMEAVMQKAIAPPESVDLGGMRPYTGNPMDIINGGQGLPPGIGEGDAARAAVGPGGFEQPRVAGNVGVPEVPLASNPATRGAPGPLPTGSDRAGLLQTLIEAAKGAIRSGVRK